MASRSPRRLPPGVLDYYDELLGTWTRRLDSRHDAEDVAHDAIVRMLEADAATIQKPRSYLHQTARNLVTDAYRRRMLHEIVSLDELDEELAEFPAPDGDPDEAARASEVLVALEAALAELPVKCQQVFVWQRLEGRSQAEIAARLGISRNMVEKYKIRAMRHLRERMADFSDALRDSPADGEPE